jgi:hypothetical protein
MSVKTIDTGTDKASASNSKAAHVGRGAGAYLP